MSNIRSQQPGAQPTSAFAGSGRQFAEFARALFSEPTVMTTLQRIVDLAADTVEGCDAAGVLLVDKGRILAGAWSNDLVRQVETMEYELGEGPCVDAIWKQPVFESADLHDHVSLWPRFAPRAIEAGVESLLGFRLFLAEDTLGALDLYGYRAGAFDDESSRAIGTVLASHASMALAGAQLHERDLDTVAGLREALLTRDVIGQAKGILMATQHVDANAAFDLLIKASQDQNNKVRTIAEIVAQTGALPEQ
ncbi:MAG TPA: GAF and ANTAR domain-containing protein [Acidimicrobiia bacterium]